MTPRILTSLSVTALAVLAAGCSADGNALSTASVAPEKTVVANKVDPICVSLASQIDSLRNEGSVGRLEKAAEGKTSNVQVKRTSLAKQAELNKANADFQMRCGPKIPAAQTAQTVAPAAATPAAHTTTTAQAAPVATTANAAVAAAPKN